MHSFRSLRISVCTTNSAVVLASTVVAGLVSMVGESGKAVITIGLASLVFGASEGFVGVFVVVVVVVVVPPTFCFREFQQASQDRSPSPEK